MSCAHKHGDVMHLLAQGHHLRTTLVTSCIYQHDDVMYLPWRTVTSCTTHQHGNRLEEVAEGVVQQVQEVSRVDVGVATHLTGEERLPRTCHHRNTEQVTDRI